MSLLEIDDLIKSLDLGDFGYGFLVSKKGFGASLIIRAARSSRFTW